MKSIRTDPRNHAVEGDERTRTAVSAPSTDSVYDADTLGAIGMARWWMRYPEHADDASRDCLRRELLTISRALARIASRAGSPDA